MKVAKFICGIFTLLLPLYAWSLPWSQDMVDQVSVKPQESPVPILKNSISITYEELIAAPTTPIELLNARLTSSRLKNPVAATEDSIQQGQWFYQINCQICHGDQGKGDGPVGKKMLPRPLDLSLDYVQLQADGQIFLTITHGSVIMPFYRDALSPEERWHLVNYVKSAFRRQVK